MQNVDQKKLKQFAINSIQDACIVLGSLISGVTIHSEKYKEYAAELDALLENCEGEYVPAKVYDDIKDKLLYRQHEILKLIADYQSSSFSYIDLRKLLLKKGYLKNPLSDELLAELNELLDVRNWTFHNPQSLMAAAKEAAEKNIPTELKESVTIVPQLNPVIIPKVTSYELVMLASLSIHTAQRIEKYDEILKSMKRDYQELFDSIENKGLVMTPNGFSYDVQYFEKPIISRLSDYHSDIAQVSMAIQKSKYDGTDESFNDWTIRMKDNNSTGGKNGD